MRSPTTRWCVSESRRCWQKLGSDSDTMHINQLKKKFLGRLWILRHLKRANLDQAELCQIYSVYLRPVIEYVNVSYHPLLSDNLSNIGSWKYAEGRSALNFGRKQSYGKCLELSGLTCLKERREEMFMTFALKCSKNERFRNNWFPMNNKDRYPLRKAETYRVEKSNYDRLKNGHLNRDPALFWTRVFATRIA